MTSQVAQYALVNAKPSIGIAGVTTGEQAQRLLKYAEGMGWPHGRKVAIGALTSYKALAFGSPANTQRYVMPSELNEVFIVHGLAFNQVHFNSNAAGLFAQLSSILKPSTYCDGVQLNVPWPRIDQLQRLRERIYVHVTLQISRRAFAMAGGTVSGLISQLSEYAGVVDRVLIDPSGGEGRPLGRKTVDLIRELVRSELPFQWGVAGGLKAENVHELSPLLEVYPGLSWDAESGLRTQQDVLDLGKCRAFLAASVALVR
jgi:phosphoribosylanthranilate isomerase